MIDKASAQPVIATRQESKKKTPPYPDRTLGCRYELKYIISESETEAVQQYIKPYLDLDRYSKLQPQGYYPIVSLYLDSQDLLLSRQTLTGMKNRYKLRIRSYSDDTQYPTFFEIKRRIDRVILKSRAPVQHQDVPILLQGRCLPQQDFRTNRAALDQFQLYMSSIMARPTILIRYMRKAYENDSNERVRVTFDRELCYRTMREPRVTLNGPGWQTNHLTTNAVILEIKFTGRFPLWLHGLASCFDLGQRGVSKIASSVQQACALGFCGPQL